MATAVVEATIPTPTESNNTASTNSDNNTATANATVTAATTAINIGTVATTAATKKTMTHNKDEESSDEEGESHRPAPLSCVVCSAARAIYKCPKCDRRSCSLDCVRRHKADNACDGTQSRSNFMPINDINEKIILNGTSHYVIVQHYALTCCSSCH
jgi:hypothetical protein